MNESSSVFPMKWASGKSLVASAHQANDFSTHALAVLSVTLMAKRSPWALDSLTSSHDHRWELVVPTTKRLSTSPEVGATGLAARSQSRRTLASGDDTTPSTSKTLRREGRGSSGSGHPDAENCTAPSARSRPAQA